MNVFSELSRRNTYNSDMSTTQQSCERTYRQAIRKLDKITKYYSDIDLSKLTEEDVYDACCEAAADLALCCELFLKSIYIYENGLKGEMIDVIWDNLEHPVVVDENNNPLYVNNGIVSKIRVDSNGNEILDERGNKTYIDQNGNILRNGQQGKKWKKKGHDLEHLITNVISNESRMLLDIMMTTNMKEETDKHKKVDLIDILSSKGAVQSTVRIPESQYRGWLNKHALTFIDARYAGQKYQNVEVDFLYHLATQCKALAEYVIEPDKKEEIRLTDEEIENIPSVISQVASVSKKLISQNLIKLVIQDDKKRMKLEGISQNGIIEIFATAKASHFYSLIKDFDTEEIVFVCDGMSRCIKREKNETNDINYYKMLLETLNPNEFLGICVYLKKITKHKIDKEIFDLLLEYYLSSMNYIKETTNKIKNNNNKILINNLNFELPKYAYNNKYLK